MSSFDTVNSRGIENVTFDDGTSWTRADLQRLYIERLSTDNDDFIQASGSEDQNEAGLGDDFVNGGNANDTYIYNRGDGNDTYDDFDRFNSGNDTVELRGITVADVTVTRDGESVILTIA